ncbi:CvfB family protein [Sporosalibacterium faouarense]|uniref:CvfB family protein n=1 Tax=Sporosalibacterium faouarense TaxID=516123 RepID=UPI00192C7CB8|nr:S1-like domain-containing RNA-binding protein [Sporosalibacterium faouarense]
MIKLGKTQILEVVKFESQGAYLNSKKGEDNESILLPKKEIPEDIEVGHEIKVFVYRDSKDRLIATVRDPKIQLGDLELLRVVAKTKIGAFLDWGLEKDLFLPFKEQKGNIAEGKEYLVGLYIDKSDRLCATMDIYKMLSSETPYKEGDKVKGTIYTLNRNMGAFVAVDNKYHGLIPKDEIYEDYKYGDEIEARVSKVRDDGRLYLSLREKGFRKRNKDSDKIWSELRKRGGKLPLNDNSSPESIKRELKMSKGAFKRAVGNLLKNGMIRITDKGIEIKNR